MRQRIFMTYEQIINQGEIGHSMFIIIVGTVKVVKQKTKFDQKDAVGKKVKITSSKAMSEGM